MTLRCAALLRRAPTLSLKADSRTRKNVKSSLAETELASIRQMGPHYRFSGIMTHYAQPSTTYMKRPTKAEIEAARTENGGFTRETLAGWGISWPPEKGWLRELQGKPRKKTDTIKPVAFVEPVKHKVVNYQGFGRCHCPEPTSPEFDSRLHGLLAPPRVTYRKIE